ncbi:MAG TPA: tRNA pseudouridine(13) synthase TruD [Nitrososphaerales archaeon]|nr:tRNA pseudouridine(13) synthase TruD [Nitrososphaerales archaeon]
MTVAAEAEMAVGIESYASGGAPCSARAKSAAEDFVVEEQLSGGPPSSDERPGSFPLYRVEKRQIDTLHMARDLAGVLRSNVSFGGLKDKRALAVQYVTPTSRRSLRPARVARENYAAELIGYVDEPISRARVAGNRFTVILRGCCSDVGPRMEEATRLGMQRMIPNFYGLQRFGASGAGTHLIGKALVEQDFEKAVRLMLEAPLPGDSRSGKTAKEAMAAGRYEEGIALLPVGRDIERIVAVELVNHPGEWVKALRRVPIKLRRLYVQAYQSFIFNRTLSRGISSGEDISKMKLGDNWAEVSPDGLVTSAPRGVRDVPTARAVPMVQVVGYAFRDYGSRFDGCLMEVLDLEGVRPGSFYVKEMQEISAEGGFRRPHLALLEPSWRVDGTTATMKFTLGKGQYATILLREVIKPANPAASGLA